MAFGGVVVGSSCPGLPLEGDEEESLPRIFDILADSLMRSRSFGLINDLLVHTLEMVFESFIEGSFT